MARPSLPIDKLLQEVGKMRLNDKDADTSRRKARIDDCLYGEYIRVLALNDIYENPLTPDQFKVIKDRLTEKGLL